MVIAIDGKPLTITVPCGLREYAWQLITNIARIDKHNTYIVFLPRYVRLPNQRNIKSVIGPKGPWQFVLPLLLKRHHTEVFHFLHQHGSLLLQHPRIVTTIHDLADRRAYPPIWENPYYGILGWYVPFVRDIIIRKSAALIVVTEAMKKVVIGMYPQHTRSRVILDAWDPIYARSVPYYTRSWVMALSDFSPRKNTIRAIQAYSALPQAIRSKHQMHIVLSMANIRQLLEDVARREGVLEYVHFYDALTKEELRRVYHRSSVLLYPSLYEGFGLPILEAMGSGCPVITSNYGAMREVAGSAAHLVDPKSVDSIAQGLLGVLSSPRYQRKLRVKGFARSKQFSWKDTARKTLRVYEELYKNRSQS